MYCYECMNETDEGAFCVHCGSELSARSAPHHLTPGTLLNGKYLIGNFIGEGGFGITYIGRDVNLDIRIAIKEYYPCGFVSRNNSNSNGVQVTMPQNKDFFENGKKRFLQEARSLAKFSKEPGIVMVRDYFEENDTAYIVMEYLEGENLGKRIEREGRLESAALIERMVPLMHSLEKFHEAGMIHRDISPDNIMSMKNGTLKLMDFGSARYFTNNELEMSVILKPGYSPEEQHRKKGNQGPWTDVYSLCATIYSCITGVIPDNALDRLYNDSLQQPSQMGVAIPAEYENALMYGLAVRPENRCQSVRELIALFGAKTESEEQSFSQEQGSGMDPYKTYYADDGYGDNPGMDRGMGYPSPLPQPQSVSYSGSVRDSKRLIILLSAVISVCVVITIAVSLLLIVPNLREDKEDSKKTEEPDKKADSEKSKARDEQKKADSDGEIEAVQMKPAEVKKLSKKYWKMGKDNLLKSTASSVIKQQEGVSNLPEYLFDGDIQTNWQEGSAGAGTGEYVSYEFKEIFKVNAMTFQLGNWKTEEYYYGNNRPKTLTLAMGDQSWTVTFPDEWVEFGLKFSSPVRTDNLTITIDDVYKGASWNDTVITDIGVWYE